MVSPSTSLSSALDRVDNLIAKPCMSVPHYTDLYPVYQDLHTISRAILSSSSLYSRIGSIWGRFLESLHGQEVVRTDDGTWAYFDTDPELRYFSTGRPQTSVEWKMLQKDDLSELSRVSKAVDVMVNEGLLKMPRDQIPSILGYPMYQCLYAEDEEGAIKAFATYKDLTTRVGGTDVKVRHLCFIARRAAAVGLKTLEMVGPGLKGIPHKDGGKPQALSLTVLADNTHAQVLYNRHLKMVVTDHLPKYYEDGRDAKFMASVIDPSLKLDPAQIRPHHVPDLRPDQWIEQDKAFRAMLEKQFSKDINQWLEQGHRLAEEQEALPESCVDLPDQQSFWVVKRAIQEASAGLSTATPIA